MSKLTIIYIILFIMSIFIISIFVPVKYSLKEEDMLDGYICEIEQTTGSYWKIKEIIGDNSHNLSINELVYLKGFDPYLKLNSSIITDYQNKYFIKISAVNIVNDEYIGDFNEITVEDWDICYPIKRESGH